MHGAFSAARLAMSGQSFCDYVLMVSQRLGMVEQRRIRLILHAGRQLIASDVFEHSSVLAYFRSNLGFFGIADSDSCHCSS